MEGGGLEDWIEESLKGDSGKEKEMFMWRCKVSWN